VLRRHHAALQTAAQAVATAAQEAAMAVREAAGETPGPVPVGAPRRPTKAHQEQQVRRERRLARYQEVMALHEQGCSQRQVATALGIGRQVIRRFLRADGFPERVRSTARRSGLHRYEPYLRERWVAGCDNAFLLWRELQAQGYPGSASNVRHFLARWRAQPSRPGKKGPRHVATCGTPPLAVRHYSPHQTTWLVWKDRAALTDDERTYVDQLLRTCPSLARLQALAQAFRALVRDHDLPALAHWLEHADQSEFPELRGFADGLRADRAAVEAGLTLPWSQGQVEGQVNRLKMLKRAMFGRAHLDLLKRRFLCAA
jgi:transposase